MQPAEFGLDGFVDDAVVLQGGFPTHAADEADGFHAPSGAILHWDGWKWTVAESAAQDGDAVLRGLVAVAPNDVWAVGSRHGAPFAVQWDGSSWQVAVLPTSVAGSLNAISGSATDLWAVGVAADGTRVLTAHWDGARWSNVPDAGVSDGGLLTVATVAPNDVWAGGDALLQHFDGTQWRDVSQSFSGVRGSLSAVSSTDVWLGAAGGMAHWDGATWQPVTTRQMDLAGRANAQIGAVSALSPTDVWAAGTMGSASRRALRWWCTSTATSGPSPSIPSRTSRDRSSSPVGDSVRRAGPRAVCIIVGGHVAGPSGGD